MNQQSQNNSNPAILKILRKKSINVLDNKPNAKRKICKLLQKKLLLERQDL